MHRGRRGPQAPALGCWRGSGSRRGSFRPRRSFPLRPRYGQPRAPVAPEKCASSPERRRLPKPSVWGGAVLCWGGAAAPTAPGAIGARLHANEGKVQPWGRRMPTLRPPPSQDTQFKREETEGLMADSAGEAGRRRGASGAAAFRFGPSARASIGFPVSFGDGHLAEPAAGSGAATLGGLPGPARRASGLILGIEAAVSFSV